jgi:hypothetical protein
VEVVPFEAWHITNLEQAGALGWLKSYLREEHKKHLETTLAFSCLGDDRRVIGCAGVVAYWPNRGEAWALLARGYTREFLFFHNSVRRFLDVCPIRRVEAAVVLGFQAGHRWVKALGFQLEAPVVRAYQPDGSDVALYSRVRD